MSRDVWVIDTSFLLEVSCCGLSHSEQMDVFRGLTDLVEDGRLALDRRVLNECNGRYFDLPGGWVSYVRDRLPFPLDPRATYVRTVMGNVPTVIEQDSLGDPADPYVLALALQLQDEGHDSCIVTEDHRDRPPKKISMVTAASQLGLQCMGLNPFLNDVGLP